MNWRVIDEHDMPDAVDAAIRALLCEAFPKDVAVYTHTRAWHDSGPAFSLVLEDQGRILAHAGVVDRTVTFGGTPLRAAGVQNVCVVPEKRGSGLGNAAVLAGMAEAEKRGFDIGLLFCKHALEKMYASIGWISLAGRDVVRVDEGREVPLPETSMAMYKAIAARLLPEGALHLGGNDW